MHITIQQGTGPLRRGWWMAKVSISLALCLPLLLLNAQQVVVNVQKGPTADDFHAWAATPPMGWNSWDCFGPTVTEAEVKANTDYMAKYLKASGWAYIIVDIRWYVENDKAHGYNETNPDYQIDRYGRFLPSPGRFPSSAAGKGFKSLADYVHSKGLKFGIHIMRGIPKIAVERRLPVKGTSVTAADIASKRDLCKWLNDMNTVECAKEGAQQYYNSLFDLYASWGVDFVKVDDLSAPVFHSDELAMIRKAIDQSGRSIVLSTSPGETPIGHGTEVGQFANMWRTVNDFWDNWTELKDHFDVFERWNSYRRFGGWPDGDMLPIGHIGIRAERGDVRMTRFTPDEQYTLMTLWVIFRSPLFFGGNLPDNDSFTLSLLTNKAVLEILQQSKDNRPLFNDATKACWIATDTKTGDQYLAVFNKSEQKMGITVNLADLHLTGSCKVIDLWASKRVKNTNTKFQPLVNPHGARLFKLIAVSH